ncbi:hypothetical protein BJ741DRAFT_640651 [Chytriomyces cf. hyalinus JEL632]|nr:hypothetical protein BJ741DRAFT_640651 [Chytriomyces cf. hyalinus JEL632]
MNCLEMSDEEEEGVQEPFLDLRDAEYAVTRMKAGKFNLSLYLRHANFTLSKQEGEAKEALQATMRFANEERKKAEGIQKNRLRKSLEKLDSMDLHDKDGEWFRYWDELKLKESKAANRRKREYEADTILTATVAKVREEEQKLLQKPKKPRLTLIEYIERICVRPPPGELPACLAAILTCLTNAAACDDSQSLIIDLRRSNLQIYSLIPPATVADYTNYIAERFDMATSSAMQDFLGEFFDGMATLEAANWSKYLEDFIAPGNVELQNALKVIKSTLPNFIRALLDPTAPLQNKGQLESRMLNDFIHPLFKESVYTFGRETVWHSGEIPDKHFVDQNRADGVGKMRGKDLPVAYFEGARPASRPTKESSDDLKIRANCVSILRQEVLDLENLRKKMPNVLRTFGAQYFKNRLSFCVADCFESVFFHSFDEVSVPKNASEIRDFADLYEAMFGWSVMVGEMVNEFEAGQRQPRRGRKSFYNCFTALAKKSSEEDV